MVRKEVSMGKKEKASNAKKSANRLIFALQLW
jgi:hypothetical protein